MDSIGEIKSWVRDINLYMLTDDYKLKFDVTKRKNSGLQLFMPNRKLIKYVTEMGGVLTGSRALKCYTINDTELLNRDCIDWDFIVTEDMVFKICNQFNIEYNLVDKIISVQKQRWTAHPIYSDSYQVGAVNVQLIVKDELPDFSESKGIRVCKLNYIINEKFKLISELSNIILAAGYRYSGLLEKELNKHIDDLTKVIIKFNCIKK